MNKLRACHKILIPSSLTVDRALDSKSPIFYPTGDKYLHHWILHDNVVLAAKEVLYHLARLEPQTMGLGSLLEVCSKDQQESLNQSMKEC